MKRTLLSLLALLMTTLCYAQDLPQATVRDLSGKPVETSTFLGQALHRDFLRHMVQALPP